MADTPTHAQLANLLRKSAAACHGHTPHCSHAHCCAELLIAAAAEIENQAEAPKAPISIPQEPRP